MVRKNEDPRRSSIKRISSVNNNLNNNIFHRNISRNPRDFSAGGFRSSKLENENFARLRDSFLSKDRNPIAFVNAVIKANIFGVKK